LATWNPDLDLRPSLRQLAASLVLLAASTLAVYFSPLVLGLRAWFLLLLFALYFRFLWPFLRLKSRSAVKQIRYTRGGWFILCAGMGREWENVELLNDSLVSAHVVFLRFVSKTAPWYQRRVKVALIDASSVDFDAFRRLKVFLRFVYNP
jgi:hypothetical protein